jgi:hypothetical protein
MRRTLTLVLVVLALGALAGVAAAGPGGSIIPPAANSVNGEPGGIVILR